jgi:tRNA nucleotidyltransferase (CCA-adding enzyme)
MNLIMTHEQADFDAMAALLAAWLLDEKAVPVLPRRTNRNVRAFLNLYGAELPFIDPRDLTGEFVEQVTLVDTQSLGTLKGITPRTRVHVVDHHQVRPDLPPDWTMSGERMGACTTLLVEVLHEHDGALEMIPATLLLLGIYEDTGSMTYVSTTPRDVRAAAHLLELGASLRIANEFLNPPLSEGQREVYERLIRSGETHLIHGQHVLVASTDAHELNEEISSVAHKLRELIDPDALFLFILTVEGLRMVARSSTDQINVAEVAAHFGGGGHERAAAALVKEPYPFAQNDDESPLTAACQELLRVLPQVVRPSISVGQIMSSDPLLLESKTSAQKALTLMQRYGYEGFPVVDRGKVIGLLTRRAVDRAIAHKLNLTAAKLMEAGEVFVGPHESIDHLQRLMTTTGWGQVPVVDPLSKKIIGIVTRTDLLKTLAGGEEKMPGRMNLANRLDSALPLSKLALLKAVAAQANELHQAVYIVGGVVRDLILERPSQDFDMVVEGDAIALGKALSVKFGGRVVAHARFGTAKWFLTGQQTRLAEALKMDNRLNPQELPDSLDLISARTEFYEYPTALPTVERSNIKLDLHRRDFTINTMAIRLDGRHYGDLYDYWGGLADLRRGLVRVLHSLSFVDDPTRMLRAVRFEQRFNFQIEERTLELLGDANALVPQVSGERLRHELNLILAEPKALAMFARLSGLGLLAAIHPGLRWDAEIAAQVETCLGSRPGPEWDLPEKINHTPLVRALALIAWFAALAPEDAQETAALLNLPAVMKAAIEAAQRLQKELSYLASARPSVITARLEATPRLALYVLYLGSRDAEERLMLEHFISAWCRMAPSINGDDLQAMGVTPGPAYREILETLRQAWLDGEITSPAQEQARLQFLLAEIKAGKNPINKRPIG